MNFQKSSRIPEKILNSYFRPKKLGWGDYSMEIKMECGTRGKYRIAIPGERS